MKILVVAAMLFIVSCNSADKQENVSMQGAYKMLSQSVNDGKKDTTYTSLQQMKIYTDKYMMYANVNPADSMSSFAIASYTSDKDTVTENIIYGAYDTSVDNSGSFKLIIEKSAKGYKQVIPDILSQGEHIKLTEEYDSAVAGGATALDGAWKQAKSYYIKGKDTSAVKGTQYKTYHQGNVIWGNTYADSTNKIHTGIGFGTFTMSGNNKVKESMTASNYSDVIGHDFDVDIEMNGTDGFTQTITYPDGTKGIEVYERLK
ncbi:MAG: hypothetical protein ABIU11_06895 [Chitinophagaceae bacterium]